MEIIRKYNDDDLVDAYILAELFHSTAGIVRTILRTGKCPYQKMGRRYLVKISDFKQYLSEQKETSNAN